MEDIKLLLIDRLKSKGVDPALIPAFLKALTSLILSQPGIDDFPDIFVIDSEDERCMIVVYT
jgi:hypothetical protein